MTKIVELKIKSKHLSFEPAIIKREEQKLNKQIEWLKKNQKKVPDTTTWKLSSLASHRLVDVKNEARATYLARAFLENRPYKTIENSRKNEKEYQFSVVQNRVKKIVKKYAPYSQFKRDELKINIAVDAWFNGE
ncbi:hypothetical protein [Synechococcus phage BUCT-ZZ01]|nr:hypothetical protein [Synechococcus phage BUCT-ZZ01]